MEEHEKTHISSQAIMATVDEFRRPTIEDRKQAQAVGREIALRSLHRIKDLDIAYGPDADEPCAHIVNVLMTMAEKRQDYVGIGVAELLAEHLRAHCQDLAHAESYTLDKNHPEPRRLVRAVPAKRKAKSATMLA